MISNATKRAILRSIHLVFSIPILGYVTVRLQNFRNTPPSLGLSSFQYLSFRDLECTRGYSLPSLASRYGSVRIICLGVRQSKGSAQHDAADNPEGFRGS